MFTVQWWALALDLVITVWIGTAIIDFIVTKLFRHTVGFFILEARA